MKQVQVDILSEKVNCPIVRMPDRRFPGIVLQGDSVRNLLDLAEEISEISVSQQNPDLSAAVASIREKLAYYVAEYEHVMKEAGHDLPYPTSGSENR
jgi:hypothetical protein